MASRLFPEFDCATCTDRQKKERGHSEDAPIPYWSDLQGKEQRRCPKLPLLEDTEFIMTVFQAHRAYKDGFLPHSGGTQDQSCLFLPIMHLVDNAASLCDEIAKNNKPQSAGSGGGGRVSLLGKGK